MATEHVEQSDTGEKMRGGWGSSSPSRFYPSCSWRPWGDKDLISSTQDAALPSGDAWDKGSQSGESLENDLHQSEVNGWDETYNSTADELNKPCGWNGDGWDQASKSAAGDGWGEDFDTTGSGWIEDAQCQGDGWCDLNDSHCDFEESTEPENSSKCSGLLNLGNTCFMNAVLQCLTYTVPFANRIMKNEHKISCQTEGFCVMCVLQDHMKVVMAASGQTVSPSSLANNLSKISRSFSLGQQQDAHEFLLYLMEGLQKCCKSAGGSCLTQAGDVSSVSDIFIGQMKSQVKCKSCAHCSDSVEPFLGLNLEIENCNSIREALSNFLAVEELEEEKVSCLHCKKIASRSKQLRLSKPPQVLAVQLKRYQAAEVFPTKIEREINYEMSLDLLPYISKGDNSVSVKEDDWKYMLYAVLVHSGWSTASGHYYCYVQTSPGVWHCMNDSSVSRVSEWTVLHQEAYILFYIQEGIKEELQVENICPAEPDFKVSDKASAQMLEKIDDPQHDATLRADNDDTLLVLVDNEVDDLGNFSTAVSPEPLEPPSHPDPMEVEIEAPVVCSQVKLPGVPKQIQSDTNESIPVQQVIKNPLSSPEWRYAHNLEEPKPSPVMRSSNSLKVERTPSPSLSSGGTQAVLDCFENDSQHSFLRLLNKMPSTRRQALLTSAMSGQEATRQSSAAAKSTRGKHKPVNDTTQARMGGHKGSSSFVDDVEQGLEASLRSREKPWTGEYDHIGGRKLQRVGGKRVMASFGSPGAHHHQQVQGVAKANIV